MPRFARNARWRVLAAALLGIGGSAEAQWSAIVQAPDTLAVTAGSRDEWRIIDAARAAHPIQIGVRPFGPLAIRRLAGDTTTHHRALLSRTPAWSAFWYNTTRAYNENTGPVWIGRGATLAASAGVIGGWGLLSYSLRPVAFWAQNADYEPSFALPRARGTYNNPYFTGRLDEPYRFGPRAYARGDWGESFVRVDTRWIAAGFSNGAQVWGPARIHPLVLSNNAGGFPHAFLETGTPQSIGIGTVTMRWMAGRLAPSGYGPDSGGGARMGIGAAGSFSPRGMAALELGATRFFHLYDSPAARDFSSLTLPFSGLLKQGLTPDVHTVREYNQIASLFMRLAPQRSRLEVYGEYYRDDHAWDFRDLLGEPDHKSSYLVGMHRSWSDAMTRSTSVTVEVVNSRMSHLKRVRTQQPPYLHQDLIEGHTLRGLVLGSPVMPGGGAVTVEVERGTPGRSWGAIAEVARAAQNEEGGTWNGERVGYYTLGVRRELLRGATRWFGELRMQPGYGDIPGTNFSLALRATR